MLLNKILTETKARVSSLKATMPLEELKKHAQANPNPFMFEKALSDKDCISFICEVKKASPSKGVISKSFNPLKTALEYESAGAAAISVLTEPHFFMGDTRYLKEIKRSINIPVLQKDFIIDEYQIFEACVNRADAILLICSALSVDKLKGFIRLAHDLGMSCLVEVHTLPELENACLSGARVIGVNNRDLTTFKVDIRVSLNLSKYMPAEAVFVSESGIKTTDDITRLSRAGAKAVLIGETLMKSRDIPKKLSALRGAML